MPRSASKQLQQRRNNNLGQKAAAVAASGPAQPSIRNSKGNEHSPPENSPPADMGERGSIKNPKKSRSDTEEDKGTSEKKPSTQAPPRAPPNIVKPKDIKEHRGSASGPSDPTP